jgi:hypothetical protein
MVSFSGAVIGVDDTVADPAIGAVGSVVVDAGSESKAVGPVSSADIGVVRRDADPGVNVGDKSKAGLIVGVTDVGAVVIELDVGCDTGAGVTVFPRTGSAFDVLGDAGT